MANKDYRHVILVVDRSGSMSAVQQEATKAINSFITDLGDAGKGRTTITLRQFDTQHDTVHDFADLDVAGEYTLVPRGMTALNDAIGLAINEQARKIADMPKKSRPTRVQFVVMTDGLENSSHEYTQADIKRLIEDHRDNGGWDIVFLSADPTVQQQYRDYGTHAASTAVFDTDRAGETMTATAANLNKSYVTGQSFAYSNLQRGKMSDRTHLFNPDDDADGVNSQ